MDIQKFIFCEEETFYLNQSSMSLDEVVRLTPSPLNEYLESGLYSLMQKGYVESTTPKEEAVGFPVFQVSGYVTTMKGMWAFHVSRNMI